MTHFTGFMMDAGIAVFVSLALTLTFTIVATWAGLEVSQETFAAVFFVLMVGELDVRQHRRYYHEETQE